MSSKFEASMKKAQKKIDRRSRVNRKQDIEDALLEMEGNFVTDIKEIEDNWRNIFEDCKISNVFENNHEFNTCNIFFHDDHGRHTGKTAEEDPRINNLTKSVVKSKIINGTLSLTGEMSGDALKIIMIVKENEKN